MAKEPFSLRDVDTLKTGILAEQAGIKPLSNFGVNFTLRPETVFGALPFVGDLTVLGQAIGKYQTEDAANRLLGKDVGFQQTLKGAGTSGSATKQVIDEIKQFKQDNSSTPSDRITRDDIQNYFMSKSPQLDLAPIQIPRFTKEELEQGSTDFNKRQQEYYTQPFASGGTFNILSDARDKKTGAFDYTKPFITEDEKGNLYATGKTLGEEIQSGTFDDQLKTTSQFAEDNINQVNFGTIDRETGEFKGAKGFDPAFARAVTIESQKEQGSYSQSDGESTFICTVLFEMNILPMSIYKYDQRYGQTVNRRIYNGYALWGKPLAERIRKQGLAYKIMTPIACAWAEQMAYDLSDGKVGKNRISIKIAKFLGETICYTLGLFIKPKGAKNGRTYIRNRQHGEKRGTVHGKDGVSKRRRRVRPK
jgi:hypothetical protein